MQQVLEYLFEAGRLYVFCHNGSRGFSDEMFRFADLNCCQVLTEQILLGIFEMCLR